MICEARDVIHRPWWGSCEQWAGGGWRVSEGSRRRLSEGGLGERLRAKGREDNEVDV